MSGRFVRVAETERRAVRLVLDGKPIEGRAGDTLLVAMLVNGLSLRQSEFGGGSRAGFCLMAACQDCWVWTQGGHRLRACDTPVSVGMTIMTTEPDERWADDRWANRA